MKVLFVCRQNVGRSQMAKAFYNKLTKSHDAEAAGTHVSESGQTLLEQKYVSISKNFFVLDVMNDLGIDMSNNARTQLADDATEKYNLIVAMTNEDDTPAWLKKSPKYVHWDVADPRGQDYENTAKVRDRIKALVQNLINTTT
ncbi:MAG: low molecular weight phosphatase family protein [Candidatus Saccharimonadales bacterium]